MMSQKATISVPSNIEDSSVVQAHESNSNPNLNNPNSVIKRKRSLPGTPDPNAEVISLSPKSLMATNRFICEVCNKGFQRDQNLQLHRRGHNLPWKLRQRTKDEVVKKKVYVCPEKSCVHNDPCRALGDLTGIKKHFSRKHGEKKWKCDKCSKKYAVQSDWKAHSKICGTRQYKCDCGTIFSRKDSFVTHRAFCDAMVEQNARFPAVLSNLGNEILMNGQAPRVMPQGLQLHGFHSEFGAEPYMANFADVNHDQHKLRMPLWLDHQTNNNSLPLNHPLNLSSNSSSSLFSPGTGTTTTLPEANNMFGTSSSWLNYRYPEAISFTHVNLSMPHGLKLEQEENKVDLSHSVSSLYQSHMEESTRMSGNISAFDNSSNFGLLDPNNMSTTSSNNRSNNNVVEIQNFNNMVNSQQSAGTNNIGGGFSLSSSKSLEHNMVMPRIQEWESGESEIMEKQQLRSSNSNTEDHLTKDFMGVGDGSLSRQMGPVMNLQSQFRGHY